MTPITGHDLRRVSADCWLCQCGFAVFGARNDRAAQQRHSLHVDEIRTHRAHVKDAQANKQQDDLGGGTDAQHWGSPFRKPAGSHEN